MLICGLIIVDLVVFLKLDQKTDYKIKKTYSMDVKSKIWLLVFLVFLSCKEYDTSSIELSEKSESYKVEAAGENYMNIVYDSKHDEDKKEAKIIKEATLKLEVEKLEIAKKKTDELVKKFKGFYANEKMNKYDWEISYEIFVRIPNANFESFIADLERGNGEILFKEVKAQDVTEQFYDLNIRLENKKKYLEQYRVLLKKAVTIKEILEIEEKIRVILEEIESTEGRLRYLNSQVDYSTLSLIIVEPREFKYTPKRRDSFFERLKESFSSGWTGLVDFVLFLFRIWPFGIILTIIIYFIKRLRKRKMNRLKNDV